MNKDLHNKGLITGTAVEGVVDIHSQKAMELFNVSFEEVTKPMRDVGKLFNYATSYGGVAIKHLEERLKELSLQGEGVGKS